MTLPISNVTDKAEDDMVFLMLSVISLQGEMRRKAEQRGTPDVSHS